MNFVETPTLYRSPSQNQDFETASGNSSTNLLSPLDGLPDLTDTVNALTEGYASGNNTPLDQSWSQPSFYGYNNAFPTGMSMASPQNSKPDVSRHMGGLPKGASYQNAYTGAAQGYIAQPSSANPFANMPTHLLQSYLAGGPPYTPPASEPDMTATHPSRPSNDDISRQTLFQPPVDGGAFGTFAERSPSPLLEVDEDLAETVSSSSPEPVQATPRTRRASDGSEPIKPRSTRAHRLSVHLPLEEKLQRAQATEGLSKQDKRRVQNKLAQRAFRARSKVANRNVFTRLEHLEELTEQQAERIVKMTDLVNRLQKENTGLKATKFEQAMQGVANA